MKKCLMGAVAAAVVQVAFAEVKPLDKPWLEKGETLVCFGDSITADKTGYVKLLEEVLASKGVKVVNAGLPGDKTPMALTRMRDLAALQPDAVMFFFGANDSVIGRGRWRDEPTVDPATYRDNLMWMIHYLRLKTDVRKFSIVAPTCCCEGGEIAAFGPIRVPYQLAARKAADRTNAVLVPLDYAFEQAFRTGVPDKNGLLLTRDGTHFSQGGKKLAAETMLKAWNMK